MMAYLQRCCSVDNSKYADIFVMGILKKREMASTELETILVGDLQLGMVVHGIAKQAGKLVVKSKGMVRHLNLIEQLSSNGVISVYVERNSPISNASLQKLNTKKVALSKAKQSNSERKVNTELSLELVQASKLIKQSKAIHNAYSQHLKNGIDIDVFPTNELLTGIYGSLARNPNALLMLAMVMNSSDYLANHAIHVSILTCYFAQKLEMSEADCKRLGTVGYLFDIGMVKLPPSLLNKPATLNVNEQAIVKTHVQHSLDILKPLKLDSEIMLAVEQHHERLDGSGYPNGFSGSKISKFSRILAIADCYDALTSSRPFKEAKTPATALKHLSLPEHGYDPKLVLQFVRHMGIYPVGSLVMLSNKRIALVTKSNIKQPNKPTLKVFYSVAGGHYLEPTIINLATYSNELKIVKPILASQYKLDVNHIV